MFDDKSKRNKIIIIKLIILTQVVIDFNFKKKIYSENFDDYDRKKKVWR